MHKTKRVLLHKIFPTSKLTVVSREAKEEVPCDGLLPGILQEQTSLK